MWRRGVWLLLVLPQWGMADELTLSLGRENFLWTEYASDGSRLLDESGQRYRWSLHGERALSTSWVSDASVHLLSGRVLYDGQDNLGNPETTDTDYFGYGLELGMSYLANEGLQQGTAVGLRGALGGDWWGRSLQGSKGYKENYQITYGRVGGFMILDRVWRTELGLKRPLRTHESVDLSDYGYIGDINLEPKPATTAYLHFSCKLSDHWGVSLNYDDYTFGQSDAVLVSHLNGSIYTVRQPKSAMRVVTMALTLAL